MIILLNPKSAKINRRIPLSVLTVGAGLEGHHDYEIVDENFDPQVEQTLEAMIRERGARYLGLTVMPGPQLVRAIHISQLMKRLFPSLTIIWGGAFPSIHTETVLQSPYVDIVVLGDGEVILRELVDAFDGQRALDSVKGIAFKRGGEIIRTERREWTHPNLIPHLPYHKIDVHRYLQRTYLGQKTSAYHSSMGCPFKCGFCSVVSIFQGRWLAQSAERVAQEMFYVHKQFGVDSMEFFDDNFFTSEKRVAEFSERILPLKMAWWGEGRSDTLYQYSDSSLKAMRDAGCKMIFTGAETSSQEKLDLMNKGGTQSPEVILEFARRIKDFDIIPEFSFIFGSPSEDIDGDIERDIQFIKKIKAINPRSEIIFYVYAPVLLPGSVLFEESQRRGFAYPKTLEEWAQPQWLHLDLRKRPMTPWLKPRHIEKIRNFERVLNANFPSITDLRLTGPKRQFLRWLSGWRYERDYYVAPYEIRFFLSKVFRYRQPELEGAPQYSSHS
jgi:anaerobic magnesium-protoporphyrin IX monomethyl ester cyclase